MAATGPISLSSDIEHWLRANDQVEAQPVRADDLFAAYEIQRTSEEIEQNGFQRVCEVNA
jgi:hypothetical protein